MQIVKALDNHTLALVLVGFFLPVSAYSQPDEPVAKENIEQSFEIHTEDTEDRWWFKQPKENKILYSNLFAATVIGIWGLSEWEYGSSGLHSGNEGWFEQDTKYGGADKLGHFWATYVFSDSLTALYTHWGYEADKANVYAAWSAWGIQAAMEFMDATSQSQGMAWQDMAMNSLGALTSVWMQRNPEIDDLIDFRVEYVFNENVERIFDDYSNHYYSVVLKLEGFDFIENSFLKFLEFHGGYNTRGYNEKDQEKARFLYAGVSLNFSRFFRENGWRKTGKTMEYLQLPYTVVKASYDLD